MDLPELEPADYDFTLYPLTITFMDMRGEDVGYDWLANVEADPRVLECIDNAWHLPPDIQEAALNLIEMHCGALEEVLVVGDWEFGTAARMDGEDW